MTGDARSAHTFLADERLADAEGGLYRRLEVGPDADADTLRSAYRRLARALHPDLHHGPATSDGPPLDIDLRMALVNEAWAVLSDPARRAVYDAACRRLAHQATRSASAAGGRPPVVVRPAPAPTGRSGPRLFVTRKEAWLDGVAVRVRFLVGFAGRSAVQTMLLRHPGTARGTWEALVPEICRRASQDMANRVRDARAAGAAPLDLANAAALLGLRGYGEELLGAAVGVTGEERQRHAEMVDRIYETLAYELPRELVRALGNAPRVSRRLARTR